MRQVGWPHKHSDQVGVGTGITSSHHTRCCTCLAGQLGLDDYGTIRVINFIRSEVAAGRDPRPLLHAETASSGDSGCGDASAKDRVRPWSPDTYLTPVVQDDPLLGYDYDETAADMG